MFKKIIILSGLVVGVFLSLIYFVPMNPRTMLAGIFFVDSLTTEQLKTKPVVRILIVPGHDNDYWGTEFQGVKEADLNVELAEYLTNYLRQEKNFLVYLLRNRQGYDSNYWNYLEGHREEIAEFERTNRDAMTALAQYGLLDSRLGMEIHNEALPEVSSRLFGINKWSNEMKMDLIIHLHFNDYAGRTPNQSGKYSGLTIYIPDKQYSNAKVSRSVAQTVSEFLGRYFAYSDLPYEKSVVGLKETQELIALGALNTLDAASLLIEYGYIYESQFTHPNTRQLLLQEMAWQTYAGVLDFFSKVPKKEIALLPYEWQSDLKQGIKSSRDVLALQLFLAQQGFYPPVGANLNDCPISGTLGDCTVRAIKNFQKENSIPVSGWVDSITRLKLNEFQ